ncbi:MAG: hypothetical protein L3J73_05515, partial [Thermoplasmata archaeon]|nr:hypothetical protein [Thermoplasmata archaeon]
GVSFVSYTLAGARAVSTRLTGFSFTNGPVSVASSDPIVVATTLAYSFPYSGAGHELALTTNLTPTAIPITLLTGSIDVHITTPSRTAVTSTSGFDSVTVSNDAWGWGAPSLSGTFTPTTSGRLSVAFGSAFPTGDLLIAAPIVALGALAAGFYLRRRRRRRAASA